MRIPSAKLLCSVICVFQIRGLEYDRLRDGGQNSVLNAVGRERGSCGGALGTAVLPFAALLGVGNDPRVDTGRCSCYVAGVFHDRRS